MCWKAEYILLVIGSTLIDYIAGIKIAGSTKKSVRKNFLIFSLIGNLSTLFLFKYLNFFNDNIRLLFDSFNIFYNVPHFNLLLPVGISFYTFQSLSYTIDVYRGQTKVERHFGIFALYVSFFPQLVAGPIERSENLLPQLYQKNDFSYERVRSGLLLMLWGFFKKIVVADNIAVFVNIVFASPQNYDSVYLLYAVYFFAFQIYCDFSGYSDIAIGSARIMGYDLMTNFKQPYFSRSIGEFWRRWHISLSTWFRDYVYIPLGGSRVPKIRKHINVFTVFFVSGIWHGANWTFIIWGAMHGFYMLFEMIFAKLREKFAKFIGLTKVPKIRNIIQIVLTFHLALIAWVFFRASNINDVFIILKKIFVDTSYTHLGVSLYGFSTFNFCVGVISLLFLSFIDSLLQDKTLDQLVLTKPFFIRWSFYYIILFLILIFGNFNLQKFIYFDF